jgi:hypothetical protein
VTVDTLLAAGCRLCDTDKSVLTKLGMVQRSHIVVAKGGKVVAAEIGVSE